MNIYSTEEERYRELKDRTLTIIPWNEEKRMKILDPTMSISACISHYAKENGFYQKYLQIEGVKTKVKFSKKSLGDSVASMCRHRADLFNLSKLLTVLDEVAGNAVQIQVEHYRHQARTRATEVLCMRQYISGFCDKARVYPVKLTVEERKKEENTYVHVIVTVGQIKKEALLNARVHPSYTDGESLLGGVAPFIVSIADFVQTFNAEEGVLLKNLPDMMLSDKQKEIKQRISLADQNWEARQMKMQEEIDALKEAKRRLQYEPEDYGDDDYER